MPLVGSIAQVIPDKQCGCGDNFGVLLLPRFQACGIWVILFVKSLRTASIWGSLSLA